MRRQRVVSLRRALMARKYIVEAFLVEHVDRFGKTVEQVGRGVWKIPILRWRASPPTTNSLVVFTFAAAIALSETARTPGGSIRPFCEPDTVMSTPHSSCR